MFQAMVAAYLLWQNRLKSKADNLLLLLLLCISTHLAIKFVIFNFVSDADVRLQMNTFIGFCYGPLLYLYALKIKDDNFIPVNKWYLFLPVILGGVGYLSVFVLLLLSDKAGHNSLHTYNTATSYSISLFNLYYCIKALNFTKQYADIAGKEKQLIKRIAICISVVCIVGLGYGIVKLFTLLNYNLLIRSICYSALVFVCLIILRFKYAGTILTNGTLQPTVPVTYQMEQRERENEIHTTPAVIRKALLTENEQQRVWDKLQMYLSTTEAYTNAELSLEKLALGIGVSKYHLSETLNSYADKTFYQYINELRVSRVKEQMRSLTKKGLPINILALAYDNGFKAKSSFNQYFKKITGHTPSAYIKHIAEPSLEIAD